jgi:hypothetical protein
LLKISKLQNKKIFYSRLTPQVGLNRNEYMAALEKASVEQDITDFVRFEVAYFPLPWFGR